MKKLLFLFTLMFLCVSCSTQKTITASCVLSKVENDSAVSSVNMPNVRINTDSLFDGYSMWEFNLPKNIDSLNLICYPEIVMYAFDNHCKCKYHKYETIVQNSSNMNMFTYYEMRKDKYELYYCPGQLFLSDEDINKVVITIKMLPSNIIPGPLTYLTKNFYEVKLTINK